MRRLGALDWTTLALLIIGGLNWLLVGLFQFDLVAALFGGTAGIIARIVYVLVGISAVYVAFDAFTFEKRGAGARTARPMGA